MSESRQDYRGYERVIEESDDRLRAIRIESLLLTQGGGTKNVPRNDPVIRSFGEAFNIILGNPAVRREVLSVLDHRPAIKPAYFMNLAQRAFFNIFWRDAEYYGYPDGLTDPSTMSELLSEVLFGDESTRYPELSLNGEEWVTNMMIRNVQSNVAQRYWPIKLFALFLQRSGRIGSDPSICDIGCSQNQGLKKLALGLPFRPVSAGYSFDVMPGGRDAELSVNEELTRRFNRLLGLELPLGKCLGIDIVPISEVDREWKRSCSFYPFETKDEQRVAEYDVIDLADLENVGFLEHDITAELPEDFGERWDDGGPDIVMQSVFEYQLTERRQQDALEKQVSKMGVKYRAYVEFGHVERISPDDGSDAPQESQRTRLVTNEHLFEKPFPLRLIVEDLIHDKGNKQEVMRFEGGRPRMASLGGIGVTGALAQEFRNFLINS